MNWEDTLAMIDKTIAKAENNSVDTYSEDSSLIEHNKEESLDEKLKRILEQYQVTKDISLLEEYLSLVSKLSFSDLKQYLLIRLDNDRNVLEEISNNKIDIDYSTNIQLLKDPELMKILIQTKNKECFTFAKEKDYLMEIDGITVMEHLLQINMFEKFWISNITTTPLLAELLIKYNKKDYLSSLSEEQLFLPYEDGILLDYLFKNDLVNFSTMGRITTHPEIYNYILKYKKISLLEDISESLLTEQLEGKYILDLILERGQTPSIYSIKKPELVELVIQKNKLELLSGASMSALLKNVPGQEITLVEYLVQNGIVPREAITAITQNSDNEEKFFRIIESHNRFDLIKKPSEAALLKKHGDKTLFEILVENNVQFEVSGITKPETVEMIYNSGKIELLQAARNKMLLYKLPNGKTILEELVARDLLNTSGVIQNEEVVKYIFDNQIYKLYSKITTSALLRLKDLNTTYLDQVLREARNNPEINITNLIDDAIWDVVEHAKARIIYAKHDMHMYLSLLTKKELLKERNGDRLIDALLRENPFDNVDKLIPPNVRQDVEIAMILKLRGLKQEQVKFESVTQALEDEYLITRRKEYELLPLTPEQEQLLDSLKVLMNDGMGDINLIAALIANYRFLLSSGSIYANEIYHLINIKQQVPEFTYESIEDGAHFSSTKNRVCMDDTNIDTLNHETGHALFNYLAGREIPKEFEDLISRLRENPEYLAKVAEYSKRFLDLKNNVEREVEETFMKSYDESITEEKRKEIEDFINNLNQREKEKYRKLGYSEELLDIILGEMYTVEEYIAQDRRIKKQNMVDLILRTQYGPFISIGDFYDGIYVGKFKGGVLIDAQGEKIKPTFGHGIEYYSRGTEWAFNEMIANYSSIIKSKDSKLGLQQLKEHIGEELYMLLEEYYQKQILQSTRLTQTTQVTL